LLPAGAFAGWGSHPLESAAFSRRTQIAVVAGRFGKQVQADAEHAFAVGRVRSGCARTDRLAEAVEGSLTAWWNPSGTDIQRLVAVHTAPLGNSFLSSPSSLEGK
jgi:hypothetical protein